MPLDHFKILAPIYDRYVKFSDREFLIQFLTPLARGRFLDAGGGTGRVSALVHTDFSQVVVADLSIQMLTGARSRGIESACSSIERLPFPDGSFDRILIMDAMHHIKNQKAAIFELWRILVPGGRLLIVEPDIRTLPVKLIALLEMVALMGSHFLNPDQLTTLLSGTGARSRITLHKNAAWILFEKPK